MLRNNILPIWLSLLVYALGVYAAFVHVLLSHLDDAPEHWGWLGLKLLASSLAWPAHTLVWH